MSNKAINMILGLLRGAFSTSMFSTSYFEATNILRDLGLNYVLVHECKYDCASFLGKFQR